MPSCVARAERRRFWSAHGESRTERHRLLLTPCTLSPTSASAQQCALSPRTQDSARDREPCASCGQDSVETPRRLRGKACGKPMKQFAYSRVFFVFPTLGWVLGSAGPSPHFLIRILLARRAPPRAVSTPPALLSGCAEGAKHGGLHSLACSPVAPCARAVPRSHKRGTASRGVQTPGSPRLLLRPTRGRSNQLAPAAGRLCPRFCWASRSGQGTRRERQHPRRPRSLFAHTASR